MGSGKIPVFIRYFNSRFHFWIYLEMVTKEASFLHGFEASRFKVFTLVKGSSGKSAHWSGL